MSDASAPSANSFPASISCRAWSRTPAAPLPGIGQWVAPTLDPAELEKRIGELRTVQYWLEQNARMLAATIQALEVQRMTLSTLKSMNVQMGDLAESLKIKPCGPQGRGRVAPAPGAGRCVGRCEEDGAPKAAAKPTPRSIRCSGGARSPTSSPSSRPMR